MEEGDLQMEARAVPGSTVGLLRWPVAFFFVWVGIALADGQVGPAFAFGSAAVIFVGWIVMALGSRGTRIRSAAKLPQQQRASRISIDAERLRHEVASGHAGEYPLSELTHARMWDAGVLLNVRGQVFFVPRRAIQGAEESWRSFVASLPARRWPTRLGFTIALWVFALLVAAYGFAK